MTFEEKYLVVLDDLLIERARAADDSFLAYKLDKQIADLRAAMQEKFGRGING